jgi:hypothetical protein
MCGNCCVFIRLAPPWIAGFQLEEACFMERVYMSITDLGEFLRDMDDNEYHKISNMDKQSLWNQTIGQKDIDVFGDLLVFMDDFEKLNAKRFKHNGKVYYKVCQ